MYWVLKNKNACVKIIELGGTMDLGLNEMMLMSLMKLKDAVESDGLERIFGKKILYL